MTAFSLIIYCIALDATFVVCLSADKIGASLGLLDDPRAKSHGLHERTTPLVGGIAIIIPWAFILAAAPLLEAAPDQALLLKLLSPVMALPTFLIFCLGTVDDRYHLSARVRLWVKAVGYLGLVLLVERVRITALVVPSIRLYLPLGLFAVPFTVLSLIALTNAVNMTDGRNGLVIGMVLIWLGALILYFPPFAHPLLILLCFMLIVVAWFNLNGRLFLGDSGAYTLSFLIGILAIYVHGFPLSEGGISSSQLATLFAIPAFDMFRLIIVRLRRGVSPMSADHDHLHHRLDRYCGWQLGLPIYLMMVALPIWVALSGARSGMMGFATAALVYAFIWGLTKQAVKGGAPQL